MGQVIIFLFFTLQIHHQPSRLTAAAVFLFILVLIVKDFPEAKKPAYQLTIDFGQEIDWKKSSVRITILYSKEDLVGKLVLGVVNFPPRQISSFISEVLTLGVPNQAGQVILITPDTTEAIIGGRLF